MSKSARLLDALCALDELAGQAVTLPGAALSDSELDGAVLDCSMLLARLAAVRLALVREIHGRGSAFREGARSTAALLRTRLRIRPVDAQRLVDLALAVDGEVTATGLALAAGTITAEQAQTIHLALRALPRGVAPPTRRSAEQLLLDQAATVDPTELARLGRHLRETLADTGSTGDTPDNGKSSTDDGETRTGGKGVGDSKAPGDGNTNTDSTGCEDGGAGNSGGEDGPGKGENDRPGSGTGGDSERARDNDRDRRAEDLAQRRRLWISDLADGTTRISGILDAEAAALLRTALDSLAAPAPARDGTPDPRTPAQRRADALVDLLYRALDAATVPTSGGVRPHLTVTIPWATLIGAGGPAASTSWGQPLPRAVIHRLACDAAVSRIILNPDSVPLDVGRTHRTVPADLRKALVARDQGCAFPACSKPPSWCQAHHIIAWIDNGATSLDNLVLVCGWHHRFLHHQRWTVRLGPDHRPEFLPPPHTDPIRSPRRNPPPLTDLFAALLNNPNP